MIYKWYYIDNAVNPKWFLNDIKIAQHKSNNIDFLDYSSESQILYYQYSKEFGVRSYRDALSKLEKLLNLKFDNDRAFFSIKEHIVPGNSIVDKVNFLKNIINNSLIDRGIVVLNENQENFV